ncbi:MAG: hypothetical protein SFV15_08830 [Polyangiaceae bacterium]|nr:hypothetical protein [Polyangiaceae bacterium]
MCTIRWSLILALLGTFACAKEDDPQGNVPADSMANVEMNTPPPDDGVGTVGSAGGTVVSADGVLTLNVPAGALSADVMFTIRPVAMADWSTTMVGLAPVGGAVYAIEPEGTSFASPATLTWRFPTMPTEATVSGRLVFLFGLAESANGALGTHIETDTKTMGANGSGLLVESRIGHLSRHMLTGRGILWSGTDSGTMKYAHEVGSIDIDLHGGRHAVDSPWRARSITVNENDVLDSPTLTIAQDQTGPIVAEAQPNWPAYTEIQGFSLGGVWQPSSLPSWRCTAASDPGGQAGTSPASISTHVELVFEERMRGVDFRRIARLTHTEPVDCFAREQKAEYTTELALLGMARTKESTIGNMDQWDLSLSSGLQGHRWCIPPGGTIVVCVASNQPTSVNYFPQYPPGFEWLDVQPPGCTQIKNLDPDNTNCVLLKLSTPTNGTPATIAQVQSKTL